jgi:hypothetical protein
VLQSACLFPVDQLDEGVLGRGDGWQFRLLQLLQHRGVDDLVLQLFLLLLLLLDTALLHFCFGLLLSRLPFLSLLNIPLLAMLSMHGNFLFQDLHVLLVDRPDLIFDLGLFLNASLFDLVDNIFPLEVALPRHLILLIFLIMTV